MKKIVNWMGILLLLLALTACGSGKTNEQGYYDRLNVYNWGDYVDPQVLEDFEKEYGIKINYENYANNEEMLAKIQAGGTDYDVIFPSEYMVEAMINQELLQEIDMNNLPNFKNIGEQFKNLPYDPENKYSIPYFWGTMGIIYNTQLVEEEIDSWEALWNPKYRRNIIMIDSARDTIGITLKKLGYSLNTRNIEELEQAKDELVRQKELVKAYEVDAYKDMMIAGEAAMALAWSGDAMLLIEENPDLDYVIPNEGTNLWFDAMAVPITSKHKREAELFIDYMMRPDVAAKCAAYVMYATPNVEAMKLLPEEITEDELAYPKGNIFEKGEVFIDLGEFTTEYDRVWTEIKAY
ncbi:ABC transporter substrate-binding protein [Geosporobacter ferrireducens]|uniref:Spermidine/putrescine ABC transporter substrate-binding protein n=1 Tax=Geosporobacter ferrireducens TaxID=1424294 RepID=A0A1D8GJ76_9FIRM|nr:spermidine/putrescine ABC transporter substrate-binding protein [Geosporobacter ferrireducens]AOT70892.1 spermidine/putrescine ABC transporter substrate-binding protein [Geosporobacter ferrireducens]MTI53598.1 spermidine/putrescine ABC transporter substrate-binding protein [Geosporobacter ferrireducens]